ncbi:hypothetical protein BJ166DRAFT_589130 [Pestalotiopsis sp. NC0098]|nr:hypothetical protein BJ166DRAFT_589130 [Pestalotiopsis sp. NC0098]
MAELQTQHGASNSLQAPRDLAKTGFPQFGQLPQEIQNAIWREALQKEAQKIVVHDFDTGGIYLSQDLISSVSQANSAAYTVANEFYNVKLDAFACDLEYLTLSRPRRHLRGVVRLHLEFATMVVGFDLRELLLDDGWWHIGLPQDSALQKKLYTDMTEAETHEMFKEYYHLWATGGRPCRDEDVPAWVTNCHITGELTESECAQVRRTVQVIGASFEVLDIYWQPRCCWNCVLSHRGLFENFKCSGVFPNVEFCRLLVADRARDLGTGEYTFDRLIKHYANLTTADWWNWIKSSLILCVKHEHLDDENEGEENNDDEMTDDDHIDTADEDVAGDIYVADQHDHNHDCTEKENKDDAGKHEDKEYNRFASICAWEENSFFF